jgi:cytochrome c biogenesis protein CcdA/glutaredoxin
MRSEFNMKRTLALTFSVLLSLVAALTTISAQAAFSNQPSSPVQQLTPSGPEPAQETPAAADDAVHAYFFYANDCPHCHAALETVIYPLQEEWADQLDIRLLEIGTPEYYEALMAVETHFNVPAAKRSIPTLVVDDQILVGEDEIFNQFPTIVREGVDAGGIPFPQIEGVDPQGLISVGPNGSETGDETCETGESCEVTAPVFAAYFFQTGCDECSRVNADLNYVKTKYPQLQVVEFNIYDHADLASWMTEQIGYSGDFHTPALFIGDQVLVGDEIYPDTIVPILQKYQDSGSDAYWLDYDSEQGQQSVIDRFKNMGWLAVVAAGLIDGINPCAFATLIFFVSYLTLSSRKGKEVLLVGASFTGGVFLAYLAVGLGLYQLLDLIGGTLEIISKVVYGLTGVFCVVLAVLSFLDYLKAKKGEIKDMLLNLPEPLRKRINATIRQGRNAANYMVGAFIAGVLVSLLELACTGQVYLPTIIFVSSIPGLRLQAFLYLVIYNLLFILPLVVIFILVYYGTTSKDLTQFLQERAALVKLLMGFVFIALGSWLLISLLTG